MSIMFKHRTLASILLLLLAGHAQAAGMQIGIGVFALARNGADIQIDYRVPHSPYQVGFRYVRWTDVFHDPFTGRAHSETTQSMSGPMLKYLFQPDAAASYYAGLSFLQWSRTEVPLAITAAAGSASTTDIYFGGGYSGTVGQFGYYNLGLFISPSSELNTQTAISSEQSSGNFDIQLQAGLAF